MTRPPFTAAQLSWLAAVRDQIHDQQEIIHDQDVKILTLMMILKGKGFITEDDLALIKPRAARELAGLAAQIAVDDVLGTESDL